MAAVSPCVAWRTSPPSSPPAAPCGSGSVRRKSTPSDPGAASPAAQDCCERPGRQPHATPWDDHAMTAAGWLRCLSGIVRRESLRFVHQRGRFFSALVRPLVWLAIFAAGFRFVLGVSISPPYETYVLYEVYIVPGLAG